MKTFTGLEYLKIDIANNYGLDQLTWAERLDWFDDLSLYGHADQSDDAKNPVLYRKGLRAYKRALKGEAIGYPMSLDATASGMQIMALLSGCKVTARNTNLIYTGKREDIYTKMSQTMSSISGKNYTRDDLKQPTMTVVYGSKFEPRKLFGDGTPELDFFYKTLRQEAPGPMDMLGIFQNMWDPTALAHRWTLPDGHVVIAKVMETVDKKIEVDELDHKTFTFRSEVNKPQEWGLSLSANIIHSVDAYVVREMIRRTHRKGIQLATIHDSFWAHPNDMNEVRLVYVQILAEIARSNLGQDILRELSGNPNLKLNKDSSDLADEMRYSEYALS